MSLIIPANTLSSGGFAVDNSARFNSGSSDSLTRTFSTPTNAKKFTISQWVKRSKINESQILLNQGADYYYFVHNNVIDFETTTGRLKTNRLFRDTNAWYHIVIVVDTTLGTADDRIKMFINGVQETSFGSRTNPSLNANFANFNSANEHSIAKRQSASDMFLNGYLAEQVFLDGTSAAITDLGEFDEDSGIWKPIDVSGLTAGTNGFYLDFKASGNLGNDVFGGTDLTENNLTAVDQSTDTCTNNFATYNVLLPTKPDTFSEGNTKITQSGNSWDTTYSTIGVNTGKWYMEVKWESGSQMSPGFSTSSIFELNPSFTKPTDNPTGGGAIYTMYSNGSVYRNNSANSYGTGISSGNIQMLAMDLDNNKFYWGQNGTWFNSANPVTNSNGYAIESGDQGSTWHFHMGVYGSGNRFGNFGSPAFAISSGNQDGDGYGNFEYAVPSGYYSLCTKNLAEYG